MPDYRCNHAKPHLGIGPALTMRCDRDAGHPGPHRNGGTCWEEVTPLVPLPRKEDVKIRQWAVEQVIAWLATFENSDEDNDDEDWVASTPENIVAHARTFEAYIRGEQ